MGTAIVTGASSGIGAVFARELAARGHDLYLVARRADRLRALAAELAARHGIQAETLPADLSRGEDVERVASRIAALEGVDLLVNNAGFGVPGNFAETDPHGAVDMIDVHLVATVRLTRAALPAMIARRRGAIINVSSLAALVPLPGSTVYSATKAFLNVFSTTLAMELNGTGVRVQVLCPGFTRTEFHDQPMYGGSQSQIPGWMWMRPEDVVRISLRALERGRIIVIPGGLNRSIGALARTGLAGAMMKGFQFLRRRKGA